MHTRQMPDTHQIEKPRFLGISRYKVKLGFLVQFEFVPMNLSVKTYATRHLRLGCVHDIRI